MYPDVLYAELLFDDPGMIHGCTGALKTGYLQAPVTFAFHHGTVRDGVMLISAACFAEALKVCLVRRGHQVDDPGPVIS